MLRLLGGGQVLSIRKRDFGKAYQVSRGKLISMSLHPSINNRDLG